MGNPNTVRDQLDYLDNTIDEMTKELIWLYPRQSDYDIECAIRELESRIAKYREWKMELIQQLCEAIR